MLVELDIQNLAIIDHTTIRFDSGLNAITGETGAGKSILLDALGAVLGARVSSDLVRTGETAARVQAAFEIPDGLAGYISRMLSELGIENDELLILSREINSNGRSTARINGRMATATQLGALGAQLVDIHGQSDHLSLLVPANQRLFVDRFARLGMHRDDVAEAFRHWSSIRRRLEQLTTGEREREQRIDLLRFQIDEIDEVAMVEGEDHQLLRERDVLLNADQLRLSATSAIDTLVGDESDSVEVTALSMLRRVEREVSTLAEIDARARELSEHATELVVLAEDLSRDLRRWLDAIEADPARLAEVDDRLDAIHRLKRKYGPEIRDVLDFRERAAEELDHLQGGEFDRSTLERELEQSAATLRELATALSSKRRAAAERLSHDIGESITELRMGSAVVQIDVRRRENPAGLALEDGSTVHVDETGIDDVEFLMATAAGETLRPIGRVASGGETARLMLAVKSILGDVDETPSLVFDEIDVGVGGRSAQMVGEKLWSLASTHQVIVISHLAQIAAFADQHFRIVKDSQDGRVVSRVEHLDPFTREEELAAMLDGIPATPESLANARAMLQRVHAFRESRTAAKA